MKDFLKYINAQDKRQLQQELKELYSEFELVRDYYQIKLKASTIDAKLLAKYNRQVTEALYLDDFFEGGLDVDEVHKIIKRLNNDLKMLYFIEVSLHAIDECTCVANDYGGRYGEEFYIYFEELYEEVFNRIVEKKLFDKYKTRLKRIADTAFEGYGHSDQLQDIYNEHIKD